MSSSDSVKLFFFNYPFCHVAHKYIMEYLMNSAIFFLLYVNTNPRSPEPVGLCFFPVFLTSDLWVGDLNDLVMWYIYTNI